MINRFNLLCLAIGSLALSATPANAAVILGSTSCSLYDISPAASACSGWYEGNLNSGSPADMADSAAVLNGLLGTSTFTGSNLTWLENLGSLSGSAIKFSTPLYGQTIVSVHVGGANGAANSVGYNGTAFYVFDAGNSAGGMGALTFNLRGLSNARLYSTSNFVPAVPEPSTWAIMILGLAAIGWAGRRKSAPRSLAS